ncbi:hypothetical protein AB6A40_006034 [Gnathostoma spinigerum]|uniref:Uncharacterized protein n=1 Tax=Gnathostoma spinigerum TaxID=75299 RepID=A0ABD6EH61_9BILA
MKLFVFSIVFLVLLVVQLADAGIQEQCNKYCNSSSKKPQACVMGHVQGCMCHCMPCGGSMQNMYDMTKLC